MREVKNNRIKILPPLCPAKLFVAENFDLSQRISRKGYIDLRLQYFEGNNNWLEAVTGHSSFDSSHNGRPLLTDFAAEIKVELKTGSQIVTQIPAYPEQASSADVTELYGNIVH